MLQYNRYCDIDIDIESIIYYNECSEATNICEIYVYKASDLPDAAIQKISRRNCSNNSNKKYFILF